MSMPYVSAQETDVVRVRIISCNLITTAEGDVAKICVVEIKYITTVTM